MQRPLLVLVSLVLLVAGAMFWFFSGGSAPALTHTDAAIETAAKPVESSVTRADVEAQPQMPREEVGTREVAASSGPDLLDDPEIRAGLTGIRGRVVDAQHQPVGGTGVRLYRGGMDSILPPNVDPMADVVKWEPSYVAGETRTAADGTFLLDRVWPRAFFILLAGIGSDAPNYRFFDRTPVAGEVLDVGDIVLEARGILTGTVEDRDGNAIPDALVRAVDLPGALLSALPVERFDPKGCLLVRERGGPPPVMEMPAWVESAIEHLPIPQTRTDAEGHFRLVGVKPGNNYVATTKKGLLGDVKAAVKVEAGETKDIGTIKLKDGEELTGRVVDTAGKPVASAEVVAGNTSSLAPVDFASHLKPTDQDGRFSGIGFSSGKVSVAARRTKGDPWVLAEPQPILGDVVVTLPGVANLTVRVLQNQQVVKDAKLKLMAARRPEEAFVFASIGFQSAVDIHDRTTIAEDGSIQITGLPTRSYVVLASAPGCAIAMAEADLSKGPASIQIELKPNYAFAVRVLGPEDKPVRNAAIYVRDRGQGGDRGEMPVLAGRTDAEGRLRVEVSGSDRVAVSADHPRWGAVHGKLESGMTELVLHMQTPGWIDGVVVMNGKPTVTNHAIALEHRPEVRGPFELPPALTVPDAEGRFAFRALQPGSYGVQIGPELDKLHSPGDIMGLVQASVDIQSRQVVEVVSGQGAKVTLELGEAPPEGPVGTVFGTVMVDGRIASGWLVHVYGTGRQRSATTDASGRYELKDIPVGDINISLSQGGEGQLRGHPIWHRGFELKASEMRECNITLQLGSIRGLVLRPDGAPAVGVNVQVRSQGNEGGGWQYASTDTEGHFAVEPATSGTYSFKVDADNDASDSVGCGEVKDIAVIAGVQTDVRIQLRPAIEFSGTIDMSVFAKTPEYVWMTVHVPHPNEKEGAMGEQVAGVMVEGGKFKIRSLEPGSYSVVLYASVDDDWKQYRGTAPLVVPAGGATGVVVGVRPYPPK